MGMVRVFGEGGSLSIRKHASILIWLSFAGQLTGQRRAPKPGNIRGWKRSGLAVLRLERQEATFNWGKFLFSIMLMPGFRWLRFYR